MQGALMIENRYSDNAAGRWYVSDECIHCDLCEDFAPTIFAPSELGDHHVVVRQPRTPEEGD